MNITIRDLDEMVFKRFKAKAVEEGMKLGEAVTQAMNTWIKRRSVRRQVNLTNIGPFNWGEGTGKTSMEIDHILYGRGP